MSGMIVYLRLGRVSNLPTVWTNVMAGILLSGGLLSPLPFALLLVSISLCYIAGMFLNDAFDREIDALERPERPIPSGQVSALRVFVLGFGMMGAAIAILGVHALTTGSGLRAMLSGLFLCGSIVLYNVWHKQNVLSPLLMGLCRMLVYSTVALAVTGSLGGVLIEGMLVLLSYLIGLSYVAKQENLAVFRNAWPLLFLFAPFVYGTRALIGGWVGALVFLVFLLWVGSAVALLRRGGRGNIPRAVVRLIAGISLLDALLIARGGHSVAALLATLGFCMTLFFQRYIRGT